MIPIIFPLHSSSSTPGGGDRREPTWLRDEYGLLRTRWSVVFVLIPVMVGIFAFAFFMASLGQQQFDSWCTPRGGHAVSVGRGEICVSSDGRVIEP